MLPTFHCTNAKRHIGSFTTTFIAKTLQPTKLVMADFASLEQRFEGISVQDENVDSTALKQQQHKAKV